MCVAYLCVLFFGSTYRPANLAFHVCAGTHRSTVMVRGTCRFPQATLYRMTTKEALEISTQEWGNGEQLAPCHSANR